MTEYFIIQTSPGAPYIQIQGMNAAVDVKQLATGMKIKAHGSMMHMRGKPVFSMSSYAIMSLPPPHNHRGLQQVDALPTTSMPLVHSDIDTLVLPMSFGEGCATPSGDTYSAPWYTGAVSGCCCCPTTASEYPHWKAGLAHALRSWVCWPPAETMTTNDS